MISSRKRLAAAGVAALLVAFAGQPLRADPDTAGQRLAAARTAVGNGDGIVAEAEAGRAQAAGAPARDVALLMAQARLLQGDTAGTLGHLRGAGDGVDALRVRARALAASGDPAGAHAMFAQAADRAPRDAGLWTDIGRFRMGIGDQAGAIEAADRAVAADADAVDALLLRAQLVRAQYGLAGALPWFEGALKRAPDRYDVLIDYAATLGDLGRARDMLAATRRALAVRPGDPQAFYLLAVLAARAGKADLARAMLERTGNGLAGVPGPLLLGATLDMDAGADEQAAAKLRNLVAVQPMNIRARQLLGLALVRLGATRDALEVLQPVVLRADADSYSLTLAARAFERLGDHARAGEFLDRAALPAQGAADGFGSAGSVAVVAAAAGGDPAGEPSSAIPLIRSLIDADDAVGAIERARALAQANPNVPQAAVVLGDTLMLLDRPGEAVAAYRRAAALSFDEPTMLRLTEALARSGDGADAADALALFLSQNPDNVTALRLSAHWQVAAGEYDAAIDTLEGLRARLGNRDAALLAELAYAHVGAGDATTAASYAAAAYALAPSNAAAADAYGWALRAAGDGEGALQLLEKAVSLAPRHAMIRWHLARVYADFGRNGEARAQAQAALSDPRFADREAAQALIAALA
ncbi:tetratricopeptide repeat protein [Sphingomonas sp.]|uniref:tetratricopeptide repeat protein n=1 Tax=Sphingomonas sp. TaxID=28214 RepID=UPI002DD62AE8|nr:tetratricopeptide repeat protein [Sphingomonas sp.]